MKNGKNKMNFMIGESHINYLNNFEYDSILDNGSAYLKNTDNFLCLSYPDGLTIISATNRLESIIDKLDISGCENIIYIFGTNDAIVKRENRLYPKEYISEYVKSIEYIRNKYNFKNAYVIVPFYVSYTEVWWLNEGSFADKIIDMLGEEIIYEANKYNNVHSIDLRNIYDEKEQKINNKYFADAVHFNNNGKSIFLNILESSIINEKSYP